MNKEMKTPEESMKEYMEKVEAGGEVEVSFPEHEKWLKNTAQLKEDREKFEAKQKEKSKEGAEGGDDGEPSQKEAQG